MPEIKRPRLWPAHTDWSLQIGHAIDSGFRKTSVRCLSKSKDVLYDLVWMLRLAVHGGVIALDQLLPVNGVI